MSKKDREIERKLQELESAVLKEQEEVKTHLPSYPDKKSTELVAPGKDTPANLSFHNDLHYFGGIGLILTGLFMLFNHVRVATPVLQMFGFAGQGFGFVLLPLLIGIGWLIYDSRNKIAWFLTAASAALIFFAVLNSMVMIFPQMTLLGTLMMLLPFAVGGALLLKGMGGASGIKEIEDKSKK